MYQDEITGAFHFEGGEDEDALRYVWTILMDLSFKGMVETIWRIITKRPPDFVEYRNADYYRKKSFAELQKMSGVKNLAEHNIGCPAREGKPVCTCQHLRRYS